MFIILWEYQVKPDRRPDFESIYSSAGVWTELFKKGTGYIGTELFHDETLPYRYLTIDRWVSKEDYEAFLSHWEKEYKALDKQCEGLTESESLIGRWDLL